jgi:hypothetical protein
MVATGDETNKHYIEGEIYTQDDSDIVDTMKTLDEFLSKKSYMYLQKICDFNILDLSGAKLGSKDLVERTTKLNSANSNMIFVSDIEVDAMKVQYMMMAHRLINKSHLTNLLINDDVEPTRMKCVPLDSELWMYVFPECESKFIEKHAIVSGGL